ncbi:MAG: ferritin family protein [Candidatus Omnitrophota bacterium]|nr:ferritin family protein [Candidatus Omnitrophota bacterium]
MNIFKASEVLRIAVQIEKNGLAFYTEVKKQSKYFPVQELFDYLAKEEVNHEHTFQALLDKANDDEPAESYPGESEMYLKAIAGENVFARTDAMQQLAQKAASDKVAIDLAIGFEKDSLIFFEELKKFVPALDQAIVDKVIAQEREHLVRLLDLKKKT